MNRSQALRRFSLRTTFSSGPDKGGHTAQMLLDRQRQRDRPQGLPVGLGLAHRPVLAVAHQVGIGAGLVDQRPLGEHGAVALPHRLALGLEQQRLAKALGGDDQHLLGRGGVEEVGDLAVEMQELAVELVQVLRLDVLRVDHPRLQWLPQDGGLDLERCRDGQGVSI